MLILPIKNKKVLQQLSIKGSMTKQKENKMNNQEIISFVCTSKKEALEKALEVFGDELLNSNETISFPAWRQNKTQATYDKFLNDFLMKNDDLIWETHGTVWYGSGYANKTLNISMPRLKAYLLGYLKQFLELKKEKNALEYKLNTQEVELAELKKMWSMATGISPDLLNHLRKCSPKMRTSAWKFYPQEKEELTVVVGCRFITKTNNNVIDHHQIEIFIFNYDGQCVGKESQKQLFRTTEKGVVGKRFSSNLKSFEIDKNNNFLVTTGKKDSFWEGYSFTIKPE